VLVEIEEQIGKLHGEVKGTLGEVRGYQQGGSPY